MFNKFILRKTVNYNSQHEITKLRTSSHKFNFLKMTFKNIVRNERKCIQYVIKITLRMNSILYLYVRCKYQINHSSVCVRVCVSVMTRTPRFEHSRVIVRSRLRCYEYPLFLEVMYIWMQEN